MFSAMGGGGGGGGQSAGTVGLGLNNPESAVVMDSLMVPIEQSNSYAMMSAEEGGNSVTKEKNLEGLLVDVDQKHLAARQEQQPLPDGLPPSGGGSMASPLPPCRF